MPTIRIYSFILLITLLLLTSCRTVPIDKVNKSLFPSEGILFASDRDGREHFYLMSLDGKNVQMIQAQGLPSNASFTRPVWVKSLQRFFLTVTIGNDAEIYSMNLDGSNLINLTNNPSLAETDPVISPDNKYIAYFGSGSTYPDIFVMNTNGSDAKNLTRFETHNASVIWSPDSNLIYFNSNRGGAPTIYSIKTDGTDLRNVSKGTGVDALFSLSPDGKQMVFCSDRAGYMDLFQMDLPDGTPTNLTNSMNIRDIEPIWSPDGAYIAFKSDKDGGSDLFLYSLKDTSIINLTKTPDVFESTVSWTPDSKHLLYVTSDGPQSDIFMIGIDGSLAVNLTNHPANDYGPIWIDID